MMSPDHLYSTCRYKRRLKTNIVIKKISSFQNIQILQYLIKNVLNIFEKVMSMKASAVFVVNALSQCAVLLDNPPPLPRGTVYDLF